MPEHASDLPITITHSLAFALPCPVPRARAYLRDPSILLGALPSVERAVARQRGTFRLTLTAIRALGAVLRPAAEVTITAGERHVTIRSIPETPHALQADEITTQVDGVFRLAATANGCAVRGTLRLTAAIPAHAVPPLLPRTLAQRTAEGLLNVRIRQETHAMARALAAGFAAWDMERGASSE